MIKINMTKIYVVVLLVFNASILLAEEDADKRALLGRITQERTRFYDAMAQGEEFAFDQDLIDRVGFGELMQIFFPTDIWDTGVVLSRNVQVPQVVPPMYPVGPEVEFEAATLAASPVDSVDSPTYSAQELDEDYSPSDYINGVLDQVFDSPSQVAAPAVADQMPAVTARRNLLAELMVDNDPIEQEDFAYQEHARGILSALVDRGQIPQIDATAASLLLSPLAIVRDLAPEQLQASHLQTPLQDQLTIPMENPAVVGHLADHLIDILIAEDDVMQCRSPRRIVGHKEQSRTPTKASGQKREREDELTTPSPRKRRRAEKEEVTPQEGFVTPGDLTPIYDFMRPPRTPESDDKNGGGRYGRLTSGAPLASRRRLNF